MDVVVDRIGKKAGKAKVVRRWTIQALLVECGIPREAVYSDQNRGTPGLFSAGWQEHLGLEGLAYDARRAFRRKVKRVRPDLQGDGERRRLIDAWRRLGVWFGRRGVRI